MREGSAQNGIRVFDLGDPEQGISHVVAPELGMVLPGATHAVPDSHASTVGGLGAMAFGCGTTELAHILATQVIAMKRPKSMRIRLDGTLAPHVTAKDVALQASSRQLGMAGGRGHVVEYAGSVVRAMAMEGRMTLCNLNIEMGGRSGFVAPDEGTFNWIAGRPFAPQGAQWDAALAHWRTLKSDDDATFDTEHVIDCAALEPQITWGTDPSQVVGISGRVPDPASDPNRRAITEGALAYMGLTPGTPLAGLPINRVFIGSCTNARLPDLEAAADVVRGRHVAEGVIALVVPGSSSVKREAEAKGLDKVFRDAGFAWGESGCSMCAGGNGDRGEPGERIVSTTNRNFENRQGPKTRTHLASPATARERDRRPHRRRAQPGAEPDADAAVPHRTHAPRAHRRRRAAAQGRHQHRPGRAGAGDARAQAGLQGAAVHAREAARRRQRGSRTSCSTSRSSAIPASWSPATISAPARRARRRCGACSPTTSA